VGYSNAILTVHSVRGVEPTPLMYSVLSDTEDLPFKRARSSLSYIQIWKEFLSEVIWIIMLRFDIYI